MKWWWWLLALVVVGGLAAAVYVARLDRIITAQFEGRRWTLPAQVYASPMELYAGLPLSAAGLEHELQRLQYRKVDGSPDQPGRYRRQGDHFEIQLRPARFAFESRPSELLRVDCSGEAITSLTDAKGAQVAIVRFEPQLIGSIFPSHGEDRIVVTPQQVPPLLPEALKAVEDHNFDTHHGVDPMGILRALWRDVRSGHLESSGAQGGSTLTQQLVKNYFLDSRRTAGRKVQEAIMAVLLESHFGKTDLMTAYINEINLGQDGNRAINGFGLASQFYFGKPLMELDLPQIATLVGLVRGPSYYDPRRHPQRALKHRNLVLSEMADFKAITDAQAQAAEAQPLGVLARGSGGYYPAYLDLVRRQLRTDYREQDLTEAGLSIYTNFDPRAQELAERILEQQLTRLDQRRKTKGAKLQGSVVMTAPQSGDVIAVLGGRDPAFDGFNRALDAKRPIGSLVKPFAYLAALESGRYNAASIIEDVPVSIKLPGSPVWEPQNYEHDINGPVPLVHALADSLNLATINLGMDIGLPAVIKSLRRFGVDADIPEVPSLLLGTMSMTPLDVAQLYTGIANGGFKASLRAVRAVVGPDGKALKAFDVNVTPVAQPDAVYALTTMMEQVVQRGTARAALSVLPPGVVVAGKTGTSSDLRDSWFAGFSGNYLAVAWVGYDDDRVTGLTGATGGLQVWDRLMAALGPTSITAPVPESLHEVSIDFRTGYAAPGPCSTTPVTVAVPVDFNPPAAPPGCRAAAPAHPAAVPPQGATGVPGVPAPGSAPRAAQPGLIDRAKGLLKEIVH